MWFGLTIARSSPASTQWCRKTEFRTERAGRPMPKETLETPSDVFTPGSSALISRMPSIVSTADGFHSSSPVVSVKVSASKISSSRSMPCSSQTSSTMRLATSSLRSRVLRHADLVDRQRDQRGAVLHRDRDDRVELVAAGLEVDRVDDRAAGDLVERGLDHVGLGRVDLDRRRLRQRDLLGDEAHLLVLVLALGQRDAEVEHVRAALDLVLGDLQQAVVVVGQQQLLGLARALRVHALADDRRRAAPARAARRRSSSDTCGGRGAAARADWCGARSARGSRGCARAWCRSSRRRCRRRSARRTRRARRPAVRAAPGRSSRRSGPGAGCRRSGCSGSAPGEYSPRKRIASRMSSGPVEQLRPMTSTFSASSVASAALMSVPSSILPPFGQQLTLVWIGMLRPTSLNASRVPKIGGLDLEDVLRGLDDDQVDAALEQALRLLGEDRDELAEADLAERRVLGRGQEAGRADRAGHEAILADRLARDLGGAAVDLERVLAEAPLVELEPRGLERVGLDDLGAGLDHRLVHALDDVRAVEHQRLVAAARAACSPSRARGRTARASRPSRRRRRRRGRAWRRGSRAWSRRVAQP